MSLHNESVANILTRPHALPQGGTVKLKAIPLPCPLFLQKQNYKFFLVAVVAGGYVGEASISPSFSVAKNGGSAAFGCKPIVHISTGNSEDAGAEHPFMVTA